MYPGNMRNKSRIMSLAYLRETVVSFRANEPRLDTHFYAKAGLIFQVCFRPPLFSRQTMHRKSENDKACGTGAIEFYSEYLFRILGYACIWSTGSFPLFKLLLSTGATIIFISANFLLLFSEIVVLTMNINLKLFANIIGVIGMHFVGLIKWCYCIWRNRKIVDIVAQLEKCHVLCQKIDESEGTWKLSVITSVTYFRFRNKVFEVYQKEGEILNHFFIRRK